MTQTQQSLIQLTKTSIQHMNVYQHKTTGINNVTIILPTELTATALTTVDALSSITNKQCILLIILKKN